MQSYASGLCVRVYAKYRYDYAAIVADNRRSLRIIQHVLLMIRNVYKQLLTAINIELASGSSIRFLMSIQTI